MGKDVDTRGVVPPSGVFVVGIDDGGRLFM